MKHSKTYTVTVFKNDKQELMDASGKVGLKKLVESLGLSYSGLQKIYAENGNPNQAHVEWCEATAWDDDSFIRQHVFKTEVAAK